MEFGPRDPHCTQVMRTVTGCNTASIIRAKHAGFSQVTYIVSTWPNLMHFFCKTMEKAHSIDLINTLNLRLRGRPRSRNKAFRSLRHLTFSESGMDCSENFLHEIVPEWQTFVL